MFRRRREKKTDYSKRLALLKSRKTRLVVKRSLNYIHVQFISFDNKGDKVIVEDTSKNLKKYGWKGHCGNLPAAYLTGLMAGLRAAGKGVKEAVLDIGLQKSVKGNAPYSAALGVRDSGIAIPVSQEIPKERIEGSHISAYANILKQESMEKFNKQFSVYIGAGLEPEKLNEHFASVRESIIKALKGGNNA